MSKMDDLLIGAVRSALHSSRRILLSAAGASVVVAYIGVTGYFERASERTAVERDLRELSGIINLAEEALKDVNAYALERRSSPSEDCGPLIGIAGETAIVQRLVADLQADLIAAKDIEMAAEVGRYLVPIKTLLTPPYALMSDIRPAVVLPGTDCGDIGLWDIAVLARAASLRPAELLAALERYFSSGGDGQTKQLLRQALTENSARRAEASARRALANADMLVRALEDRARANGPYGIAGHHATLAEARAATASLAVHRHRLERELAGKVAVQMPALPVEVKLADLLWIGPFCLALAFALSSQAMRRAIALSRRISDEGTRVASLAESEELVHASLPDSKNTWPDLTTVALLALSLLAALVLWIVYCHAVAVWASCAYVIGLILALIAAVVRWHSGRTAVTASR